MLLQRLATGATGVKQARYRRGPTRGSEALYAHAQYNTQPVGPWPEEAGRGHMREQFVRTNSD